MRRVALTVSGLSLALLLVLPGAALAVGTLDQEQSETAGTIVSASGCWAQTFTAGRSGLLDRVSLSLLERTDSDFPETDLRVQIVETSGGVPQTTALATEIVDADQIPDLERGWLDIDFSDPASVVAEAMYAIQVVETSSANTNRLFWATDTSSAEGPYTRGAPWGRACDGSPIEALRDTDFAFKTYVTEAEPETQPDGRIRRGWGNWTGGNIYNTTGDGQSRQADAEPGHWRSFRIEVQNDGDARDKFVIDADGAAVDGYRVKFMKRTTEITSSVNQGTFQTRWLDPGERSTIEAWVKVQAGAAEGSQISRLVSFSSLADPTKVDAVRFTVSRR